LRPSIVFLRFASQTIALRCCFDQGPGPGFEALDYSQAGRLLQSGSPAGRFSELGAAASHVNRLQRDERYLQPGPPMRHTVTGRRTSCNAIPSQFGKPRESGRLTYDPRLEEASDKLYEMSPGARWGGSPMSVLPITSCSFLFHEVHQFRSAAEFGVCEIRATIEMVPTGRQGNEHSPQYPSATGGFDSRVNRTMEFSSCG
jgi:hypothetical protein